MLMLISCNGSHVLFGLITASKRDAYHGLPVSLPISPAIHVTGNWNQCLIPDSAHLGPICSPTYTQIKPAIIATPEDLALGFSFLDRLWQHGFVMEQELALMKYQLPAFPKALPGSPMRTSISDPGLYHYGSSKGLGADFQFPCLDSFLNLLVARKLIANYRPRVQVTGDQREARGVSDSERVPEVYLKIGPKLTQPTRCKMVNFHSQAALRSLSKPWNLEDTNMFAEWDGFEAYSSSSFEFIVKPKCGLQPIL
ncbi:hypothetical protein VNO77_41922 [Canavalia gladiata]|uniref:Uncharacterized protein n=1 Tax=Canavalia gladiata TaxID=3824 RepID=A0AAN9JZB3_CANGL